MLAKYCPYECLVCVRDCEWWWQLGIADAYGYNFRPESQPTSTKRNFNLFSFAMRLLYNLLDSLNHLTFRTQHPGNGATRKNWNEEKSVWNWLMCQIDDDVVFVGSSFTPTSFAWTTLRLSRSQIRYGNWKWHSSNHNLRTNGVESFRETRLLIACAMCCALGKWLGWWECAVRTNFLKVGSCKHTCLWWTS